MRLVQVAVASAAAMAVACSGSVKPGVAAKPLGTVSADVLQHHKNSTKDGLYVDPLFTRDAAANLHRETDYSVDLPGQVYAQPLYVENGPGGTPAVFVATELNYVLAIDASSGAELWRTPLDPPATHLPCGNINPEGVTGTPVIDLDLRAIYLGANTEVDGDVKEKIYALSIDDGSVLDGWPLDVPATVSYGGLPFNSPPQGQRGGLLLLNGYLYVPYGGRFGDCGSYRGWVVAVPQSDPSSPSAFVTDVNIRGGGIWAPAGLSSDGVSVFASTGNTFSAPVWSGGEGVFRLGDGATFSGDVADHFYPSNWRTLDGGDADISGVAPMLIDMPDVRLVVLTGKNGVTYLLNRDYLGGMGTGDGVHGEGLFSDRLIGSTVINAPAAFTTANGTFVAMVSSSNGIGCPTPGNLVVFQISPDNPPTASVVWCASVVSTTFRYGPIVTTPDGFSEPVLWTISANRMQGFDAETGEVLFDGGGPDDLMMSTPSKFISPIAVNGRIFVAAGSQLYAFTTQ